MSRAIRHSTRAAIGADGVEPVGYLAGFGSVYRPYSPEHRGPWNINPVSSKGQCPDANADLQPLFRRPDMKPNVGEPVVSVLMPIANGERFLPEALKSLLAQTLQEWELIAVLDGCT